MAEERGYGLLENVERSLILPFTGNKFDVVLPAAETCDIGFRNLRKNSR